jgi:2-methylisocitrate lyase-like PEP mutase family enzyme
VSADLEHGFADDPAGVAETVQLATQTGLAGCSIEDSTGNRDDPIYEPALATERIAAASEAAHTGTTQLVLTARAENFLYGRADLADTIDRLQRFSAAGADVLYAPGLSSLDDIRTLVAEVDKPVNVIARPGAPTVPELAEVGVARISLGGALAWVALAAVVDAAHELLEHGTYGFLDRVAAGREPARAAFT